MISIPAAKLLLAVVGVAMFLAGIRTGLDTLRWAGIALVVIAWLLRFVARLGSSSTRSSPTPEDR